jgi:hypothetical protein
MQFTLFPTTKSKGPVQPLLIYVSKCSEFRGGVPFLWHIFWHFLHFHSTGEKLFEAYSNLRDKTEIEGFL